MNSFSIGVIVCQTSIEETFQAGLLLAFVFEGEAEEVLIAVIIVDHLLRICFETAENNKSS